MESVKCSNCNNKVYATGLCSKCYQRKRFTDNPETYQKQKEDCLRRYYSNPEYSKQKHKEFLKRNPDYHLNRKKIAEQKGLCLHCQKRKMKENRKHCEPCLEYKRRYGEAKKSKTL